LTAVAILGKLAAGAGAVRGKVNRWAVGIGMIPRGEVGLIFAGMGLSRIRSRT
jgi:Kef-type K+ transport system membrane component KefB